MTAGTPYASRTIVTPARGVSVVARLVEAERLALEVDEQRLLVVEVRRAGAARASPVSETNPLWPGGRIASALTIRACAAALRSSM